MKTYSEKLKDPRWQRKRLEIMQRDQFKCQQCGEESRPLCVHHWRYEGEPWDASEKDLATLCEDCHSRVEQSISVLKSSFGGPLLEFLKYTLRWDSDSDLQPLVCRIYKDGFGGRIDTLIFANIETNKIDCMRKMIADIQAKIDDCESQEVAK